MKQRQKLRLAKWSGRKSVKLHPTFKPVTYGNFESVCLLIGLSPDDFRQGKQAVSDAVLPDPFATGKEILALVLVNSDDFDLSAFEKPVAEELIAHVLATFFFECMKHFERQKQELRTMLGEPVPKSSFDMLKRVQQSLVFSPG